MSQGLHLLVDVGNSRIKWRCAVNEQNSEQRPAHSFAWEAELLATLLDNNWDTLKNDVSRVSIANVAGDKVQQIITQWCNDHWQLTPQFFTTQEKFKDIHNGYDNYQSLGIDRWLAVIAAHQQYPDTANIIVDCGSAITVDTVLPNGRHLPGPIMPGEETLLSGLLSKTDLATYYQAQNNSENPAESLQAIVIDTKSAILSGAKFATSKAVEAIVNQTLELLPDDAGGQGGSEGVRIIATGGAAQSVMALTTLSTQTAQDNYLYEPDLVLQGLEILADSQQ